MKNVKHSKKLKTLEDEQTSHVYGLGEFNIVNLVMLPKEIYKFSAVHVIRYGTTKDPG